MAKKFGKFLLFTAAVGTAAAAIHYYLQKKKSENAESEDEDYDDFSDESKSYVPLTPEDGAGQSGSDSGSAPAEEQSKTEEDSFTPLKEAVENAAEKADDTIENVEEFFDEEDGSGN